jgi:hemerythrin-like domain-containing protein
MPLLRDFIAEHERSVNYGLREHIAKEEDGLFPASLPTLDGEQWDEAMAAWRQAHPGARMIGTAEPYRFN